LKSGIFNVVLEDSFLKKVNSKEIW